MSLGFSLSTLNAHQRKTTLLDWHCSACSLFFKASNSEENYKTVNWGFNVLFNTDQRCWIFKTSLAFQLNDVSQFCRLFFSSQVCHPVQWCSVILIQLFLCSQVWSKVLNSFAHLVQHRTTKSAQDCWVMLKEFGRVIKFAKAKNAKSVSQQNEGAAGVKG